MSFSSEPFTVLFSGLTIAGNMQNVTKFSVDLNFEQQFTYKQYIFPTSFKCRNKIFNFGYFYSLVLVFHAPSISIIAIFTGGGEIEGVES